MAKAKKPEEVEPGAPMWMATFGDLMSLLLTFFILLLSFSTVHEVDFKKAIGSLQKYLGVLNAPALAQNLKWRHYVPPSSYFYRFVRMGVMARYKQQEIPLTDRSLTHLSSMTDVAQAVTQYANQAGIADKVSIDFGDAGIKIRLPTVLLFEEGGARLKETIETKALLQKIVNLVKPLSYSLSVEGHTDNRPISNPDFRSNWDLAGSRAISVVEYFGRNGFPKRRLQAVSAGEYQPFTTNDTLRGRKLNRRVELKLDVSHAL